MIKELYNGNSLGKKASSKAREVLLISRPSKGIPFEPCQGCRSPFGVSYSGESLEPSHFEEDRQYNSPFAYYQFPEFQAAALEKYPTRVFEGFAKCNAYKSTTGFYL